MNATAKLMEIHQEVTIAIRARAIVRNVLVMKIRLRSIKTDNLDDASRHGCKSDAE